MKIKMGYVSNSSSSSFLVKRNYEDKGITCLKLNTQQILSLKEDYPQIDQTEELYLTEYLYDITKIVSEMEKKDIVSEYDQGGHFGPYDEEYYNKYGYKLFLKKQHDVCKQMTFNKFVKEYKNNGLPSEVLVKYTPDGVFLKYVY